MHCNEGQIISRIEQAVKSNSDELIEPYTGFNENAQSHEYQP